MFPEVRVWQPWQTRLCIISATNVSFAGAAVRNPSALEYDIHRKRRVIPEMLPASQHGGREHALLASRSPTSNARYRNSQCVPRASICTVCCPVGVPNMGCKVADCPIEQPVPHVYMEGHTINNQPGQQRTTRRSRGHGASGGSNREERLHFIQPKANPPYTWSERDARPGVRPMVQ